MDKIVIRQLKVETVIGAFEAERSKVSELLIDLEIRFDISKAAKSDSLKDALDYATVAKELKLFIAEKKFYLLEALASSILEFLKMRFQIDKVYLAIYKKNIIAEADVVGLVLDRL